MGEKKGRPCKYVTIEKFEQFLNNDFHSMKAQVAMNKRLLWIILSALIGSNLIDRFF